MRKPIQISTAIVMGDGNWQPEGMPVVTALCDDGSIWCFHALSAHEPGSQWVRMPEIPQCETDK